MKPTRAGVIARALAERTPARMLRAFIDGLSARSDVRVLTKKIGGPAPAALLRANRGKLPDDLLAFFAEMNGATFRYTLIPDDTPIDGFEIDPLRDYTRFAEREEIVQEGRGTGIFLGDFGGANVVHLLLDNIQNERPVHYIKPRKAPPNAATIVYSPRVDRPPHHRVAKSFGEYVRRGIERAFALEWPRADGGRRIAARLDAPARAPSGLGPGARVVSKRPQCCAPNGRATVVQVDKAPRIPKKLPGLHGPWKWDDELVLLTFDHGPTCYVPRDSVTSIKKGGVYEAAWADPAAFLTSLRDAAPDAAALTLARIGVSGSHHTLRPDLHVPDTAPRLFALLQRAPRPLVVDVMVDRLEKWLANPGVLSFGRKFATNGSEYEKVRYKQFDLGQVVELAAGALALWFWWLANEQSVKSLKAELPGNALARLGALAKKMSRTHQGQATARFLAMAARGGRLPPYPAQTNTGWLVWGAKAGAKFSLHPWGFVSAGAFGLKSKHRVYWN